MKKILFMLSSMNIGGVEKSLLSLLSVIPKEKYDITVLLLEKKGGFLNLVPDWVKVEEVKWFNKVKPIIMQPPQQTIDNYMNNKQFFKVFPFVSSYLISKHMNDRYIYYKHVFKRIPNHKDKYDVAIAYQGPTDIIDYYLVNKVTANKKISWIHFDVSKHPINVKLYNKLHNKFNKIFVVSKEARKRLIEKFPNDENKADVFLNIITPELIKELAKESCPFDDGFNGINIVTVGRLSREKGQDIAIKSLSKLKKKGYDVKWYCVGDGNARKEYEQLIENLGLHNDFILLGSKKNPYPYIQNADIYVQPSRHEGYCLTLAEAKCLNKPIVSTNFTGANEQLTNSFNGIIIKTSEEELTQKILWLIDNPIIREKLSTNLKVYNGNTTKEIAKFLNYIS
ncbi:glycosyltransferase [Virgibacillus sp. DJP39]|uniref:glycosyltransferase n=1 Tax=Virgibacillus sp. DJP39 TaxID=3409790 RepID=UPI003BB55E05